MKITHRLTLSSSLIALALLGCSGEEDDHDHSNHDHGEGPVTMQMALGFMGHVGADPFSCERSYMLGTANNSVEFSDFKLYVSEVTLVRAGGEEVSAKIMDMDPWQNSGVAMLDFEDGVGTCSNGTAPTRTRIDIEAPEHDDYTGFKATLGVPFELNHADVGALASPLNLSSMFWSWQGGRKFLRVDGKVDGAAGMRVHLGSIACEGTEGDISSCGKENRGQIELLGKDPTKHMIKVDLAPMFQDLDLSPTEDKSVICMSGPDTPSCTGIFNAMGVSYESGAPDSDKQSMMTLTDKAFDASKNTDKGGDASGGDGGGHEGHGG
jgi:uncharacterized repeat protein (TIGR04052 family)